MPYTEDELHEKTRIIAEQYYGTAQDQNQIPITKASQQKLRQLHPSAVLFQLIDGEPVSWIVVVPTTRILAEQFVRGEITEKNLFDQTVPSERYEALYFCSVFTVPDHQRKGYATALLQQAIADIPLTKDPYFFGWTFSAEGAAMHQALTKKFGITVHLRTTT